MTDREKTIITAYTGVTMLQGEKLDLLYDYVSKLIGRPVQTLELVFLADEIHELSKPDFLKLCAEDTERRGEWKPYKDHEYSGGGYLLCTKCNWRFSFGAYRILQDDNYCPHCGARMKEGEAE